MTVEFNFSIHTPTSTHVHTQIIIWVLPHDRNSMKKTDLKDLPLPKIHLNNPKLLERSVWISCGFLNIITGISKEQ